MKPSSFNVYSKKGGYGLIANLLSGSAAVVSAELVRMLEDCSENECSAFLEEHPKMHEHLAARQMLVTSD